MLVLAGALATGHRHRVYDAVVLKMLGATRWRLLAAYALEYLLIGLATAIVGVAAGSVAASLVMTEVMNLSFVWLPVPALAATVCAAALTIAFGLIGTFSALGQKPAPVLRHLSEWRIRAASLRQSAARPRAQSPASRRHLVGLVDLPILSPASRCSPRAGQGANTRGFDNVGL